MTGHKDVRREETSLELVQARQILGVSRIKALGRSPSENADERNNEPPGAIRNEEGSEDGRKTGGGEELAGGVGKGARMRASFICSGLLMARQSNRRLFCQSLRRLSPPNDSREGSYFGAVDVARLELVFSAVSHSSRIYASPQNPQNVRRSLDVHCIRWEAQWEL
ncbi:hypothetical protein KM043_004450 [Ampulex compressa]|nr:hypothetical protein KM043_004450 [Ampulex compressa]